MSPWAVQIKRVCRIKRFDINTAWAVLVSSPRGWHLFGVRRDRESASALVEHCSHIGCASVIAAQVGPLLGGEIVEVA